MSMKIPMSNSNWSTSRLPQWHKKELSGSHGFQAKQIVSWWYKREGSPGLPAETWWKFTLAILPPSEPSTFWINIWTNILCLMQRLQILLYSLTCHQELNRNPVTLCVCVCSNVSAFVESHNCRAQDSRRVSSPVTARTDRSVPGMTPAWSNASCAEMSKGSRFQHEIYPRALFESLILNWRIWWIKMIYIYIILWT